MIHLWIIYAFIAFIGYFLVGLLFKYVAKDSPFLVSLILYGAAAASMFLILLPKMEFTISPRSIIIAILIGLSSVTATVFALKSIKIAPNPGYTVAIYSASSVLVTIASVFLFGASLTPAKLLGVLATFLGLILLSV